MVDKQRERAVTCSSRRDSMSVMAFRGDGVAVFRVCGRFALIAVHRYRPAQRAGDQSSIRRERRKPMRLGHSSGVSYVCHKRVYWSFHASNVSVSSSVAGSLSSAGRGACSLASPSVGSVAAAVFSGSADMLVL